ncbi:MAG: multidrug efflux SMR transporter [Micavibrio sp.]|nr:multidrug efflux SMR transporter [Micavibrio sp.]
MDKSWLILIIAGLFETGWAVALKYSNGMTKPAPAAAVVVLMGVSLYLLGYALKALPLGTAYAVWTGIGAIGTALLGLALFNEPATPLRLGFIGLIAIGILGLKYVTPNM